MRRVETGLREFRLENGFGTPPWMSVEGVNARNRTVPTMAFSRNRRGLFVSRRMGDAQLWRFAHVLGVGAGIAQWASPPRWSRDNRRCR